MCCGGCGKGDDKGNDPQKVKADELTDGKILSNRSCTDCCCPFIFALFMIGWIIIMIVAVRYGDPNRMLLPENFRGELCGDGELKEYPSLFVPKPSRLDYGICVSKCPSLLQYVCNTDKEALITDSTVTVRNNYYNHTAVEYATGVGLISICSVSGICTTSQYLARDRYVGLTVKVREFKCFPVLYPSGATLNRCLPFQSDTNATLLTAANETLGSLLSLVDKIGVGSFFTRGFGEVKQCWRVILICSATASVLSIVWIFLLRWILAPIVYLVILLIFCLFIVLGALAMLMADDLEKVKLPGDSNTDNQVILWRILEYTSFALAAMYVVLVLWMINRIRIAIVIMEEASNAFTNNPGMILIPIFVLVVLVGFIAWFLVLTIYIQTMGNVSKSMIKEAAVTAFGEGSVNLVLLAANASAALVNAYNISGGTNSVNTSAFDTIKGVTALHAYNFFGFLWVSNFAIMFGFFVMAMIVVTWYFSATTVELDQNERDSSTGRRKSTGAGTMLRSVFVAIRYHLGTILFGALLIAIIQFIRAAMLYIERQFLDKWKDQATVKVILYCIHCCLACMERIIKIISKNAFIICCIQNTNFCSSAFQAMKLLLLNILRVGTLTTLSVAVCFLIKLCIVGCNLIIAFGLLRAPRLTELKPVESGLFPVFAILILTFLISSLFVNTYECCVDAIMMCFFVDEDSLDAKYMPPALSKLVNKFADVEAARKKYEQSMKEAAI